MTNCHDTTENDNYSFSSEEISPQELQFSSPLQIESVRFVDESMPNQVFTPILMGRNHPRFKTYIQLDSGVSTNLIGMKMACYLNDHNLVNFVYPSFKNTSHRHTT